MVSGSKTKKVLIITSYRSKTVDWAERERYVEAFYQAVQDSLDNTVVMYTTYKDIVTSVINGTVRIFDRRHDIELDNVDLVHFKNWMFDDEYAALLAFYFKNKGIAFYNEEVDAGLAWGKISQICRLAFGGVPVPDTFFAKQDYLKHYIETGTLPSVFKYPLIIKADDGAKGNDNHLVKNKQQALDILDQAGADKEYVVQNFLPNDGDYRYLFAGTNAEPLVFMRKAVAGTHLNNTSQGGAGSFVSLKSLPKSHLEYARKAAKILKREVSGVDIIVDKTTNKPYVLEVNSTPAFATGYGIDKKQLLFKRFIEDQLMHQEEE